MSYEPRTDDRILSALLRHGQDRSAIAETEPAEDLFELFVEGKLSEADEEEFYQYLDANPEARQAASLYLASLDEALDDAPPASPTVEISGPRESRSRASSYAGYAVALAACLLLAVGVTLTPNGDPKRVALDQTLQRSADLIADGRYDEATRLLEGVDSVDARAPLLAARAAMHEPNRLADTEPWSLLAYGYELGDAVTMDGAPSPEAIERIKRATELLGEIENVNPDVELARAWLSLKKNDAAAAAASLDRVLAARPEDPAALLGRGVAHFMRDEFDLAEDSFKRCLRFDPSSFAARINLAKTFAEQADYANALTTLQAIDPTQAPSDAVRHQIATEIERLSGLSRSTE